MDQFSGSEDHRKAIAMMICLFLAFVYVETVWKPFFQPQTVSPGAVVDSGSSSSVGVSQGSSSLGLYVETPQPDSFVEKPKEIEAQSFAQKDLAELPIPSRNAGYPTDLRLEQEGEIKIETQKLSVHITLLGGRAKHLLLKDYLADLNRPNDKLNLIKHLEYAPLPLGVYSGEQDDAQTQYRLESVSSSDQLSAGTYQVNNHEITFVLVGRLSDGREVRKKLTFYPDGYFFDVEAELSAGAKDATKVAMEWTQVVNKEEASILDPYDIHGFVWYDGQRASREAFSKVSSDHQPLGDVSWVSMGDKYFMAAMLSRNSLIGGELRRTAQLYRSRLLGGERVVKLSVFAGPKSYELLKGLGHELQLNIDFGKTGVISAPLLWLMHWFYGILGNYGLAIVCLTIFVRMAVYPLNATSFKQMKAMQDLKPEMDRIREQITDKQQQQVELMQLYKKKGVNPLGGCLPVAIQLPIFIGLFSALRLSVELRHAPYALWINDLSAPEKLMVGSVGVPVMVILFIISMMVQQWTTPSSLDPVQKKVMMVMPIVFGFMFANFPSGLTLYWLTSNLISIGQQKAMYSYDGKAGSAAKVTGAVCVLVFALAYLVSLL